MTTPTHFPSRGSHEAVEEGLQLTPRFDRDGLVAAVVVDDETGEVVMLAWMNDEALARTIATREGWYWSRSRQELWHKGATSGHIQTVTDIRVDCDQDAILLRVRTAGTGANCHTGRKGCFYRRISTVPEGAEATLEFTGDQPLFDPKKVYGG
jgi:phosphoribosyl-AMP cyclohydrolase